MNAQAEGSAQKRRTIRSVVLGLITIVLVVFFTIPSIPGWWAVFNLPWLQARIQETEKRLATEQDALEKLEVKKLMSPSDPLAQEKLEGKIVDLKKEADLIRAELSRQKQLQEIGKAQLAVGTGHTIQTTFWLWLKHLLEIGGFVAGIGHVMDGMKRLMSWLGLLRVST